MSNECKDLGALAAIEGALEALRQRIETGFDGVFGQPPNVGGDLAADHCAARDRLINNGHSFEEIAWWTGVYGSGQGASSDWPPEYENDLRAIVRAQQIARHGLSDVLPRLVGAEHYEELLARARSAEASKAARITPRKPRAPSMQMRALRCVIQRCPDITASQLCDRLRESPEIYDDWTADALRLVLAGGDIIVTKLNGRESVRIKNCNLNAYLRRAREQLGR